MCLRSTGPDSNPIFLGGEGGIRTHGTIAGTTVFKTVPFDRSGTSPYMCSVLKLAEEEGFEPSLEIAPH
jgi:hypothetical protein